MPPPRVVSDHGGTVVTTKMHMTPFCDPFGDGSGVSMGVDLQTHLGLPGRSCDQVHGDRRPKLCLAFASVHFTYAEICLANWFKVYTRFHLQERQFHEIDFLACPPSIALATFQTTFLHLCETFKLPDGKAHPLVTLDKDTAQTGAKIAASARLHYSFAVMFLLARKFDEVVEEWCSGNEKPKILCDLSFPRLKDNWAMPRSLISFYFVG